MSVCTSGTEYHRLTHCGGCKAVRPCRMIIGESPAPWHVGCGKIKSRARVRSPCGPMPITGQRGLAPPGTWLEPAFDLERLGRPWPCAPLSGCRLLCFPALFSNINTALMLPQAPFPFQIPFHCSHARPRGHARPSSHITQDALYLDTSQRVLSNPADTGREPCDAGRSMSRPPSSCRPSCRRLSVSLRCHE